MPLRHKTPGSHNITYDADSNTGHAVELLINQGKLQIITYTSYMRQQITEKRNIQPAARI